MHISLFCQTKKKIFLYSLPLSVPFSCQKCPFNNFYLSISFPFLFAFLIPAFLPCFYFLTQGNIITQFPLLYTITYSFRPIYLARNMKNSNQNVKLLIILSSSAMLTLMSMATICSIIVISFFTSSLHGNQFTMEGRAQLQRATKERDPDCVKFEYFDV